MFLPLLLFNHQVMSESFVTPMDCSSQVPLSLGFLTEEYWSELPFLSPGILALLILIILILLALISVF